MRLLDRYLLRELLVPLGYCLGGFLIFWISFDLFSDLETLQRHKMNGLDIAEYYLVKTPDFLVVVLPVALLLALLYTLTHLARHHEITAIRGAGVSLWRLSVPYLAVGLAASLVLFAFNERWLPDSEDRADAILHRHEQPAAGAQGRNRFTNLGFKNARDGHTWQIGVYDRQNNEMLNPQVDWMLPDGSHRLLTAERGVRSNRVWTFFGVREFRDSGQASSAFVPALVTNMLAVPELKETPEEIRSEIKISQRLSLRSSRRADLPVSEILDYLRFHPNPTRDDRFWLYTKLHGRLAAPWTCLVVVLIALPFGAASGKRNVFVGVAGSIFICFAYFVLQQVGLAMGTGGYLPAWLAAWFPNLAFGGAGLWLTAKVR